MARKSNQISILQFDAHTLSRLKVQPAGEAMEVLSHEVERGTWATEAECAAALRAFAAQCALADEAIYTLIPRHEATVRVLAMPSQNSDEIASMVRLSAEEFVPYPADELIIAYSILQKLPGGESRVQITLVHRDIIQAHMRVLEAAGITPEQIFLSTACLANAFEMAALPADTPTALVALGSTGIEVLVFSQGRLAFSRGVASVQDWAGEGDAAASAQEELAIEVRGSLAAYRRESEDGLGADSLIVTCDWTPSGRWAEALESDTGKDCMAAPMPARLVSAGGQHLQGAPWAALGAALSALGRGRYTVELLPQSVVAGRRMEGARALYVRAGAMAALFLLALGILYGQMVYTRNHYITQLKAQRARLEPNAAGITAKQEQLLVLRRQVEQSGTPLEYLGALAKVAPEEGLNFTRINYARETGIELFGRALVLDEIHAFTERVRGMKSAFELFAQARSVYEEKAVERTTPVFLYQIDLSQPDEEEEAYVPEASQDTR